MDENAVIQATKFSRIFPVRVINAVMPNLPEQIRFFIR